jgi:hypothetical protein
VGARVRLPLGPPPGAARRRVDPLPPAAGEPRVRPHLEHGVDADPRGPDRALPHGRFRPLLRAAVDGLRGSRVGRAPCRFPPADRPEFCHWRVFSSSPATRPTTPRASPSLVSGSGGSTTSGPGAGPRDGEGCGARPTSRPARSRTPSS